MISSKNNKQFWDGSLSQSVPSWRQKINRTDYIIHLNSFRSSQKIRWVWACRKIYQRCLEEQTKGNEVGQTLGVEEKEKEKKDLEHQKVISEVVSTSLAEELGDFIILKMLSKKLKHYLILDGLRIRTSSTISQLLTLDESLASLSLSFQLSKIRH